MAAKRGLGKGIDAMISGDDTKAKKVVKEVIKVSQIVISLEKILMKIRYMNWQNLLNSMG